MPTLKAINKLASTRFRYTRQLVDALATRQAAIDEAENLRNLSFITQTPVSYYDPPTVRSAANNDNRSNQLCLWTDQARRYSYS